MNEPAHPPTFLPLRPYQEYPVPEMHEMHERSRAFSAERQRRRTVRQFSDRPVPRAVIEACLAAAGTAPSGAHQQPCAPQAAVANRHVSPGNVPAGESQVPSERFIRKRARFVNIERTSTLPPLTDVTSFAAIT